MSYREYANVIRRVSQEEVEAFGSRMEETGLSWSSPEIVVWNKESDLFTVEVKIEFYLSGELFDIFEFFIYRDGRIVVSVDEVRQWIRQNVPTVLDRTGREAQ